LAKKVGQLESDVCFAAASWVEKVGGAGSCNYPTDSCKLPTAEIYECSKLQF